MGNAFIGTRQNLKVSEELRKKSMHIHILGICGTFMGGLAALAKEAGFTVSGADLSVYPPMSDQLCDLGISLHEGYDEGSLNPLPDHIVIGNALSRGKAVIETILNRQLPYSSGPEWLYHNILQKRKVIAISGTHGKTTTSSMVAWILDAAGLQPGFLIGGVPENFGVSARLGQGPYFVIEADEYDSAFFDKRSKFIHYHPQVLIINNLEYDHADIFPDLASIQRQFHHVLRTVPSEGRVIVPADDANVDQVLAQGVCTPIVRFGEKGVEFTAQILKDDGSEFEVYYQGQLQGRVSWPLVGQHNVRNALAAIAAAHAVGVPISTALKALAEFKNVKRRLEKKGQVRGISVYDDFAHHPTAIATTLQGLRARIQNTRLMAVLELGSYTMKTGVHKNSLPLSWNEADQILILRPDPDWGVDDLAKYSKKPVSVFDTVDSIIAYLKTHALANDQIVMMSNKGFSGICERLLEALDHE